MHNWFIDPVLWPAEGASYEWQRNHESEEASGKTRQITGSANTGNVGRVRQQGMSEPYSLRLKGRIVHRQQYRQFWRWFELCETQTIHFVDHEGFHYEVQITSFTPRRVRKERAHSPDPDMQQHYYEYDMEMTVYSFIDGDMADMAVTP